jgi:hypothetical protein
MKKIIKISLGILLALVLSVSAPILGVASAPEIAMAATSEPKTTVSKVTLYVGYKTYQIKFENLSKSASLTFKSSNTKIAKVSKTGIITPIAKGSATVTVTMKQNSKTYTSKIKVTVSISNIKITAKTGELYVGETYTFKATAYGTASKISWSVSDEDVAKISSTTGKLTARSDGEVEVIATAGTVSSSCTVVVRTRRLTTESVNIECYDQKIISINVDNAADDESVTFAIDDTDIVDCKWGDWDGDKVALLIDPADYGSTTITITTNKSTDKLVINVTVKEEPEERDPKAKELTAKEIYEKCAPSTVELQVTTTSGDYIGSGFFIQSGIVITNYHVIEGATNIVVVTNKNKTYEVQSILGFDETYDIAVLNINAVTEHLVLNKGDVTVGETVYALGSPRGLTGSLSDGIVSSSSRIIDGVDYVQVTAPISNGNSGGPLLNAYGEVIGINTFIVVDSQNLNFAVNGYQYAKLNYDSPITAEEFYTANQNTEPTVIQEDESKSGYLDTSQYLADNTIVNGSLRDSNSADCYHITLSEEGSISGLFLPGSSGDFPYLYFDIIDWDMYIVGESKESIYEGTQYREIDQKLPAGDYYIIVYSEYDYMPWTMSYTFIVNY